MLDTLASIYGWGWLVTVVIWPWVRRHGSGGRPFEWRTDGPRLFLAAGAWPLAWSLVVAEVVDRIRRPPLTQRERLDRVLRWAQELGITIRADEEATELLDELARRVGVAPRDLRTATLGDVVLVRPEYATDSRMVSEEISHARHARHGTGGLTDWLSHELNMREELIECTYDITHREKREIRHEIELLTRKLER